MVGNLLHGGRVGKGVVSVTAIGHAMVPASTDIATAAGGGDRHRIPSPRGSGSPPGGPSTGGTGSETARASKEHEGAGCSARRPRSGHGVGRRSPEGWSGHRVRGRRTARTRRGQAVGCSIGALRRRWSSLWRRGASSGSGRGQVVEAGAGGLPAKWLPGAGCLAGRPLHLGGIPVPRGSPGRGSGSSGWRAPRPCTGVPRSSGGGRGVGSFRAGRRQPFAGLERTWGLILSRSCCTMYVPSTRAVSDGRHPTARGITNSRCRTAPIGRAGRAPRPGWVVVGEGPGGEVGGGVFRDLGVWSGGWAGRGVSVAFFFRCGADHVGVFVGIVRNSGTIGYERGNHYRGCFSGFGACRVRAEENIWHALSRGREPGATCGRRSG